MQKVKPYRQIEVVPQIMAEKSTPYGLRTYISLFSSAGIGCYGFKEENFYCIATVELLERRLKIQSYNQKCAYESGYIGGDLTTKEVKDKVFTELDLWKKWYSANDLDVLIATPPCQGMSVANHKKKDELKRNSLVVESIKLTKRIKPKFFIFENVRAFLTSICTDIDGIDNAFNQFDSETKTLIEEKSPFEYAKNTFTKYHSQIPQNEKGILIKTASDVLAKDFDMDFHYKLGEWARENFGSRKEAAIKLNVSEKTLDNWKNRK